MQIRSVRLATSSAALALLLAACSGGSSTTGNVFSSRCTASSTKFCLVSCNLGCSNTECSVSQIAQNQPISLNFSQPVDPNSINTASVLLRTQSGEPPIGDLLVSGSTITFQPKIEIQGGATFFGFRANETYILTLPAGAQSGSSLRSTSGEALGAQVSCQLVVSRGIIDLDNQPPKPTLVSPATASNVSRGVTIVIEFSEFIDAAPFAGSGEGNPIEFGVSRGVVNGATATCSETAQAVPLPGVPLVVLDRIRNVSVVSFRPSVQLAGHTCIEVRVTNRVRDLSGRAAEPITYKFVTEPAPPEELSVVEEFDSDSRLDRASSSTLWAAGLAQPGILGGSGKHGDFNPNNGVEIGGGIRLFDLDRPGGISIPAPQTLTAREERVTDGQFEFTTFRVPAGVTVRFAGATAPRIRVRGEVAILGTIDLAGVAMPQLGNSLVINGQAGGLGGAGGGRGGNGSNASVGGAAGFHGFPGQDLRVPATHAYAGNVGGTGGRGGFQYPADRASITHAYLTQCSQVAAGGSGGGFFTAGARGVALRSPSTPPELGQPVDGGIAFNLFPIPPGVASIDHFLVGGSGGGGGGSSIYGHRVPAAELWRVGCGGSGGGGAIAIRAGGTIQLTTAVGVAINVRGGDAFAPYLHQLQGPPAPGGGGSGGSILLQSATAISAPGIIDLRGGLGVYVQPGTSQGLFIESRGGDGSPGFVRAEVPGTPSPSILQNVRPAVDPRMVGTLTDTDPITGFLTKWYGTAQIFAPRFKRYEVEAEVNGNTVIFSDDPTRGVWAPIGAGTPIEVIFQGGDVDPRDGSLVGTPSAWSTTVGPHQGQPGITNERQGADGFRFTLIFNQRTGVTVRKVSVFFQG